MGGTDENVVVDDEGEGEGEGEGKDDGEDATTTTATTTTPFLGLNDTEPIRIIVNL